MEYNTVLVQVLAMVRFLPSLWDTAWPLAYADLSGFSQFAAFDCILPGPIDKLAYTRILLTAFGVPALLFSTFLLAWIVRWGLGRAGAVLQQRADSQAQLSQAATTTASLAPAAGTTASQGAAAGSIPAGGTSNVSATGFKSVSPSARNDSGMSCDTRSDASAHGSTASKSRAGGEWLRSAASSVVQAVPSAAITRLQRFGARQPPVALSTYLSVRLIITAVVLGYSCYSLFTSSMLQTLACHPIREVADSSSATEYGFRQLIGEFGRLHHGWLHERYAGLERLPAAAAKDLSSDHPALCLEGPDIASGVCQVGYASAHSLACHFAGEAVPAQSGQMVTECSLHHGMIAYQVVAVNGSQEVAVDMSLSRSLGLPLQRLPDRCVCCAAAATSYWSLCLSTANLIFFRLSLGCASALQVTGSFWKQDYSVQVTTPS
jgi:hypothetical protein